MTDEMKKALALFEDMVQRRISNTGETHEDAYDHVMNYLMYRTKNESQQRTAE